MFIQELAQVEYSKVNFLIQIVSEIFDQSHSINVQVHQIVQVGEIKAPLAIIGLFESEVIENI